MERKEKKPYGEPRLEIVLIMGSDVIATSSIGSGSEEDWTENTPSGGWV